MHPTYFLTFTTYGTWLHGDRRGSVDHRHNQPGEPFVEPSFSFQQARRSQMRYAPLRFTDAMRAVVCRTLSEVATHKDWQIAAANVQNDHVHILVFASDKSPEDVTKTLKAYCTRRLREAGLTEPNRTVWTEGGSKRQLWNDTAVQNAKNYTLYKQRDNKFTIPQIEREA